MQNGHSWSIRRQIKKDVSDVYLLTTEIVLLQYTTLYRTINKLFIRCNAIYICTRARLILHGKLRKTWNAIFTPSTQSRWQIFPTCLHIDRPTCSHNNPRPAERVRVRETEQAPVAPTCVQNRHRHSNIFSLACVLIRTLINACHDAPHLSRVSSYPPPLPLSLSFSHFIPLPSFACSLYLPSSSDQNSYLHS